MRSFNVFSVLGVLVATSAFASQVENPQLEYYSSKGAVPPQYQESLRCRIYGDKVTKEKKKGGVSESPTTAKTAFTAEVKDIAKLKALVKAAAKGKITTKPGPVGGPSERYQGIETVGAGAPKTTTLKATGGTIETNSAPEAKTLIKFTDFNCKAQ